MPAIYKPKGAAQEYSKYACNLYVGCSNKCEYCYCKQIMRGIWSDVPTLKKCLKNEYKAFEIFNRELIKNKTELQEYGLFFTFSSDSMLTETIDLNLQAIELCLQNNIPVIILTKKTDWTELFFYATTFFYNCQSQYKSLLKIGFTLTGCDELEPFANINQERIEAMQFLKAKGFYTWASIEPIIDFKKSYEMIEKTIDFCDEYKIGLKSGARPNRYELIAFVESVKAITKDKKVLFKNSIKKYL